MFQFYIGYAYDILNQKLKAYKYYQEYLNLATVKVRCANKVNLIALFNKKVDQNLFIKYYQFNYNLSFRIEDLRNQINQIKDNNDSQHIKLLKDQNLFYLHQKLFDYDQYEADLFKAIFQYKVFGGITEAD